MSAESSAQTATPASAAGQTVPPTSVAGQTAAPTSATRQPASAAGQTASAAGQAAASAAAEKQTASKSAACAAGRLAAAFIGELRDLRRLSPATCKGYQADLARLLTALNGSDPAAADERLIRAAIAADFRSGLGPATLARRLSAWRMFFDFAIKRGQAFVNPAREVRAPRAGIPLPKALTPDEAARFFTPQAAKPADIRDAAIFELLYSSALRVGELVALDVGDLDFRAKSVRVRAGKGGGGREAPVGDCALRAIKRWLAVRAALWKMPDNPALFTAAAGRRLSVRAVQLRIKKWAQKAGFTGDVTPHQLRHSCASHLLQSSGDLRAVQEMLGHRDIASTQIYTHLDFQALAAVYDKAHPRARVKPEADG